ncbi:MAG: hypothetical protein E7362_03190 [Clostridiales bacterium]|nr:hypothetical protein [Clostridiales bacterium]
MIASLEYGRCFPLLIRIFIIFMLCLSCIFMPLIIIFAVPQSEIIFVILADVILFAISLWLSLATYKIVGLYRRCLKDGVVLTAQSEVTDRSDETWWLRSKAVRIKVTFYLDGVKCVRRSGQKGYKQIFDGSKKAGYDNVYWRYSGREITILYSKKYDHVFILKD